MDKNRRKSSKSTDGLPSQNPTPRSLRPDSLEQCLEALVEGEGSRLYEALTGIKNFLKGPNEIAKFRHLKGIDKLINILPNINSKFLGLVLSILGCCCSEEKSCYKIAQCGGIKLFADTVLKMLATDSLRNRFCRLIGKLAAHDSCCILIHDEPEIVKSIVSFLTDETDNECRLAVCKAIRSLANNEPHQEAVLRWQALREIALLLKIDNSDVIMQSLATVSLCLKRCSEECVRQLVSAEAIQSLCTLSSRRDLPDIAKYSMSILLKIPMIKNLRPYLGFNNAVELFIRSAETILDSDMRLVRTKELRQLYHLVNALCLCCRDCANRIKIKEVGGLGLLVKVLKIEQLDRIYDRVISGLVSFNYYVEGLEVLCNAEVFDVLVAHLYRCMKAVSSENIPSENCGELPELGSDELRKNEEVEFDDLEATASFLPLNVEGCTDEANIADEITVGTFTADEEVTAITAGKDGNLEAKSENNLPRYSIHSPTYKAVVSEMKFEDDVEHNPRNIWEGFERYGKHSDTRARSPSFGSSPLRPSSSASCSSPREPYSPMSMSSYSNSEPVSEFGSPRSENGLDPGWSPCISGSEESRLSPVPDPPSVSLSAGSPASIICDLGDRSNNSSSVSLFRDEKTSSYSAVSSSSSNSDSLQPCPAESLKEDKQMCSTEGTDGDASLMLTYNGESFRRQQHYARMLEKYEGVFQSDITSQALEDQPGQGEKRKRSLSLETLTKIQKTVDGDIKRSAKSCLNLEEMVSQSDSFAFLLEKSSSSKRREMSSEAITMINILNIFWRALDLGNSSVALCSTKIIRAILDYINCVSFPSRRATKLLLRLSQNMLSFGPILKNGIPSLFYESLVLESYSDVPDHVPESTCDEIVNEISGDAEAEEVSDGFCAQMKGENDSKRGENPCRDCIPDEAKIQLFAKQKLKWYGSLTSNLSIVGQSPFGEGIIVRILKRGSQAEKERCIIELCHIAKNEALRKQYFLKLGGLKMLMDVLSNPDSLLFLPALQSVCLIAKQLLVGLVSKDSELLEDVHGTRTENFQADNISFVLENGDLVSANRAEMTASSEVFRALLDGHFVESTMSSVPILHTSTRAFQFLVGMIRNEPISDSLDLMSCVNSDACGLLMEVLRLGNQYLMAGICEKVGGYICRQFLDESNTEEVFSLCVALNCNTVVLSCLSFIFSGIKSPRRMLKVVEKLLTGSCKIEFLSVLTSTLENALSSNS